MIDGRSVTIEIDADLCVAIYDAQIGAGRLVRRDLLESAVAAPFAGFGGYEAYPTLIEKAARLAYGIAEAQPVMCQAGNLVRCGDCHTGDAILGCCWYLVFAMWQEYGKHLVVTK